MIKKTNSKSAFFYLRTSVSLILGLAGVSLALLSIGQFSAQAEEDEPTTVTSSDPLIPPGFDCAQFLSLSLDKQENLRAGAISIYCGEAQGGTATDFGDVHQLTRQILAPLFGGMDVDVVTGTDSITHPTQSETYTTANPDNPNQIFVAYNDSRTASGNYSGGSVSSDGGVTFTRLNPSPFATGHGTNFGDPVVLYQKKTGTFYAVWLATACGGQGIGAWTSTDGGNTWAVGACVHSGSSDDRESGWVDNNPSSPFYGRIYVSYNDFTVGGGALYVSYSDNGTSWTKTQINNGSPFIRDVQITGDLAGNGNVYLAGMNENGGGFPHTNNNLIYKSTNGGVSFANTYTGPGFPGPGVTAVGYFACMFSDAGGYWRHEGWGEPAAYNNVVHLVYAQQGSGGDAGDVYYIRSTDGGVSFSAPLKLNTDSTTRPQWQPNVSVSPNGTVFATWYDGRGSATCSKGNPAVPCYGMWSRKSTDNGQTFSADEMLSDVQSPLPGQPDGAVQSIYAGDYDYSSATAAKHYTSWTDGRVIISNQSQQDVFTDSETAGGGGGGGANLVSAASQLTHGSAGTFDITMPLTGTSGVEDRDASGNFLAVFTFDAPVTSGAATIVGGTATAGTPAFSGSTVSIPLTGVANQQIVTIRLSNINGASGTTDVPFGFLIGDVTANRLVDRPDFDSIKAQAGNPVTSANFRNDVFPNGTIERTDATEVKTHKSQSIP
ncbi:MAG: sialidase family protein [Chthoniobacterales bacterium]